MSYRQIRITMAVSNMTRPCQTPNGSSSRLIRGGGGLSRKGVGGCGWGVLTGFCDC